MSQENLDLVRSIFASWERGDFSSAAWADPEIEFVIADGPAPGSWKGLAGMAKGWREFLGAWEEWREEAEGFRELDHERVLVLVRMSGRGKASGLEAGQMRAKAAKVFHVRGGKVTSVLGPRARPRSRGAAGGRPEASRLAAARFEPEREGMTPFRRLPSTPHQALGRHPGRPGGRGEPQRVPEGPRIRPAGGLIVGTL